MSAPFATATPAFNISAKLSPVMVVTISDVFSIFVRGAATCGLSFGTLSKSGVSRFLNGSGKSGISIVPVTCTFSRIFCAISGDGSAISFGFLNKGLFLYWSLTAFCLRLLYFSCCIGVSGLKRIFNSIAAYTYLPSLNHKIKSSHSSRHSAFIPAS